MESCVGSSIRPPYRTLPPEFNALPTRRARWFVVAAILVAIIAVAAFVGARAAAQATRERAVASKNAADELIKVGDVLKAQGDLAGALKSYRVSLQIREKPAKQDPGNAGWQSDLAWSFRKVGHTLQSQGKLSEALAAFQNFKETLERLTAKDSSNTNWQGSLALS